MITRKRLPWALGLALVALALNVISTQEIATLYLPGTRADEHFVRVWVADAPPFVWVRVDPKTRDWLEQAGEAPGVTLWRGDERSAWLARVWEREESAAYVDSLFRAKYGYVDRIGGWLRRAPTVPVRLEPR